MTLTTVLHEQACIECSITQQYRDLSRQHKLKINPGTTVITFPISSLFRAEGGKKSKK